MASDSAAATAKALAATAASVAASAVFIRSIVGDFGLQSHIAGWVHNLFSKFSKTTTIVIDEYGVEGCNYMFKAAEAYLSSKLQHSRNSRVGVMVETEGALEVTMHSEEEVEDVYRGNIRCKWRFFCHRIENLNIGNPSRDYANPPPTMARSYELSFHESHREEVLGGYLPFVMEQWRRAKDEKKAPRIHASGMGFDFHNGGNGWMGGAQSGARLKHPATFDTLAVEPQLRRAVMEDLERFLGRKEYYRSIGKAWKRGYLLYGPPGTGKSSLIAAMANHLRFDVYDLDLSQVRNNAELRMMLLATENRSMLVVEDIDCSIELNREEHQPRCNHDYYPEKVTLSGFLNLLDGLWSSIGDERIIVFTTNHKERLDPALLRPGRMDMHIHMSYITPTAFRVLASNYHSVADHHLFSKIDRLIGEVDATPAELAEELLRSEEVDVALQGVVEFLETKRSNKERAAAEDADSNDIFPQQ